jgi:hypothetical protein
MYDPCIKLAYVCGEENKWLTQEVICVDRERSFRFPPQAPKWSPVTSLSRLKDSIRVPPNGDDKS